MNNKKFLKKNSINSKLIKISFNKDTNIPINPKDNVPIIFLISHENSQTGAPIVLLNVKNYLDRFHIKNQLLYLTDNIDIISIIKKYSKSITICNTLLCYKIIEKLLLVPQTKIYWYIHEWLDSNTENKISNILNNKYENLNYIFICKKAQENYKKYFPFIKKSQVIYNSYIISSG